MKLIGYERKSGSFKDKDTGKEVTYDNYKFYTSFEKDGVKGVCCDVVTAKANGFSIFGAKDVDECLGKSVLFICDTSTPKDVTGKVQMRVTGLVVEA